jgi:hypothetical protein
MPGLVASANTRLARARFEEAVAAHCAALEVRTSGDKPTDWETMLNRQHPGKNM